MFYSQIGNLGISYNFTLSLFGAHNQSRTDDLFLTMELLYQLSYMGKIFNFLNNQFKSFFQIIALIFFV